MIIRREIAEGICEREREERTVNAGMRNWKDGGEEEGIFLDKDKEIKWGGSLGV